MQYDVIIVGAGPAGSTTARECASRGLSVLLLDRAEFPRDKPCGGGVNVRTARLLPFDLADVTECVVTGLRVSVNRCSVFDRTSSEPLSYLTQRRLLDTFLVEKAVAAGATLRERTSARSVERTRSNVTVRAGSETFQARTLVAADGANGPTARLAGIAVPRSLGIALEGNITPDCYPPTWRNIFGIDVGATPGGYGWLFPKGDHVNVGVGGWYHIGPTLRPRLDEMTRFYGFDPDLLWGVRGHPLPVRVPTAPLVDGNILLVGDSAGLLDPLTGEGIYAAVWSGRSAAEHLTAYLRDQVSTLDGYRRAIETDLVPDLRVSTQLHYLFHTMPPAWAQLVRRSSRAWRLVCALMTGDFTYAGIRTRSGLIALGLDVGTAGIQTLARMRNHPALSVSS